VLKNCARLLKGDAGEQLDEPTDRHTVLKVLEEGGNRHARAPEYPRTAYALCVAFDRRAA